MTGFNIEVEGDLIFIKSGRTQHVVLHLVDRGTRWAMAVELTGHSTAEILHGLDQWMAIVQVLIFDGEQGLNDEEATILRG